MKAFKTSTYSFSLLIFMGVLLFILFLILLCCNIGYAAVFFQCQKKKSVSAFNRENSIYEVNMVWGSVVLSISVLFPE